MTGVDLVWSCAVSSRTPPLAVGNPPPRQGPHRLRTACGSGCQPLSSRQGLRRFASRFSLSVTHCSQGTEDEKCNSRISLQADWSPLIRLGMAHAAPTSLFLFPLPWLTWSWRSSFKMVGGPHASCAPWKWALGAERPRPLGCTVGYARIRHAFTPARIIL